MLTEFTDPRLVAIYDTVNPYEDDAEPGFYLGLAAELDVTSIVDLGCGTGQITCALARHGYRAIGVDPSPRMLDVARHRPDGELVRWIDGDAAALGTPDADLAIMTGHVAQFFLTDDAWRGALTALHDALRPGGHLSFESRNPEARAWDRWAESVRVGVHDPVAGPIETWIEVDDVSEGVVSYAIHYAFAATGETLVAADQRLRFRSETELTESLADAGFTVERVYGDWDRRPADPTNPELVVVATR